MLVLVTGGAGFIGSHLARALIERGAAVRVLDNFSSGDRRRLEGAPVEIVAGDVRDAGAVQRASGGVTHVVHLAALVSVPQSVADPLECNAINVTGTLNVLLAAREAGARRVVFASSSAVYGEAALMPVREDASLRPLSPYGASKLAGEHYCAAFQAAYGLETVSLRFFNVFGPRQNPHSEYAAVIPRFITALLEGRCPTIYGDGEQTRDFTYVADVAEGIWRAMVTPGAAGQPLNLATGEGISLNELLRLLRELTGLDLPACHTGPRPGDIRHSTADIARARSVLGFTPQVSLREGLAHTLRYFAEPR
jgi:UDP-glucose 4-epimerase